MFKKQLVKACLALLQYDWIYRQVPTLVSSIKESLTKAERKFLISVRMGKPEWELLGLTSVEDLPAVKWKLINIKKMEKKKHKKALEKLRNYLEK